MFKTFFFQFDLGKTSKKEIVSLFKCIASLLLRVCDAFPDVQATNSIGTDAPPYHQTFEKRVDNVPL